MKTKIFDISNYTEEVIRKADVDFDPEAVDMIEDATDKLKQAANVIAKGGLVVFPTETVYGLGANAFDPAAVGKIYKAKGRPADNPTIVHIARPSDIYLTGRDLTASTLKLASVFWPGPLTMVVHKRPEVPSITTAGLETVGVRLPDHPAAIELISMSGVPIAAPSANLSGGPSPTKGRHAIADMDGRVEIILVGADSRIGIESTVVDMTASSPVVLRPGFLSAADLAEELGKDVKTHSSLVDENEASNADTDEPPKSPGMKYRHYAPEAEMYIIEGKRPDVENEIARLRSLNEKEGRKVGVILFDEKDYVDAAHDFYAKLRELDDAGSDLILAGALDRGDGLGFAVMNRMMRSAGHHVIRV
ncbi:MAG: threonylcarbamoyl-AMP synthase [Clostridiales Family XIII bacterium]|nr:threonylcarbamoyl-AMP synthase [Clostridiales Family XIII bacterium]